VLGRNSKEGNRRKIREVQTRHTEKKLIWSSLISVHLRTVFSRTALFEAFSSMMYIITLLLFMYSCIPIPMFKIC